MSRTLPEAPPPEVELEDVACPLGCPRYDDVLLDGQDRLHDLPGTWRVVRCKTCGLARTTPRPTAATIGYYYPSEYRLHAPIDPTASAPSAPATGVVGQLKRQVGAWLDPQATPLPEMAPGHFYEVGCGNGGFMLEMQRKGWSVEGLEVSPGGAESARNLGFRIENKPLETAAPPEHKPDLVAAWMVIEHLHEPVQALSRLASWVEPGAYLVASVPNTASLEFTAFKDAWYALQVPTHLFHYTPETLAKVLDAAGWAQERVFHHRNITNLVASTGYRLRDLGAPAALAEPLETYSSWATWQTHLVHPFARALARFGQTGRMTVWARRR